MILVSRRQTTIQVNFVDLYGSRVYVTDDPCMFVFVLNVGRCCLIPLPCSQLSPLIPFTNGASLIISNTFTRFLQASVVAVPAPAPCASLENCFSQALRVSITKMFLL